MIVHLVQEIRLDAAYQIKEEEISNGNPIRVLTPKKASDAVPKQVNQADRIQIGNWWRTLNADLRTPAVSALIDPKRDPHVVDIHEISRSISVYVAQKNPLRVITPGKAWAGHLHPFAPISSAERGPILREFAARLLNLT